MKALNTIISSKIINLGTRTCEKCGTVVPILEMNGTKHSYCLNCDNLALQKEHQEYVRDMDKRKNEVLFERYSIIPEDLSEASFDNYHPNHPTQVEAHTKSIWYAKNFGTLDFTSMLLKGPYGVGKSHLAKSIADTVKKSGHTVIYIDVPQLLRGIKNTFKSKISDQEIYKAVEEVDLVVFDDLGAEYVKKDDSGESWVGEVMFEMFSARTNKAKIITTNCGSAELREMYGKNGGRIVSRMMKGTKVIPVDGKDLRINEF